MQNLTVFENPAFGTVRTVEVEGEPWLVGKDVAAALGYANPRKALADHVDAEDKGVTKCYTLGGEQDMTIINESGLYSLVRAVRPSPARRGAYAPRLRHGAHRGSGGRALAGGQGRGRRAGVQ